MSTGALNPPLAPRRHPRERAAPTAGGRSAVRLVSFAALSWYGVAWWGHLTTPAPSARLLGLVALAVAVAGGAPLLRRWGLPAAIAGTVVLCLLALPVSGLPWHLFIHAKIAVGARHVGDGLSGLPSALVPYEGPDPWVTMVITMGAAVLLLNAAIVVAFAPSSSGDGRRALAALPLIALTIVPTTLVRPGQPYAQGLLLFALLAAFVWGERIRTEAVKAALGVLVLAGVGAAIAAPSLDAHHAWVDYRAWASSLTAHRVDAFVWNQSYGPLHWPRKGNVVLNVSARTGSYWKAENLDVFDGRAWVAGGAPSSVTLPAPSPQSLTRWSQTIRVTLGAMRTDDVIAAGFASNPLAVPGGDAPGVSDGTWVADRQLGPGTSYVVNTYSPQPTAAQMAAAGTAGSAALAGYRTVALPVSSAGSPLPASSEPAQPVVFPEFGSGAAAALAPVPGADVVPGTGVPAEGGDAVSRAPDAQALIAASPYARVYALARRLAAGAATPYAVAENVMRYLGHGFTYNEDPPASADPLASFLLKTRLGYCQQFSGAMALLLRMDGVPARVSAGFTTGVRSGDNGRPGSFTVTDVDAHAWVEVWFPRYGWVTFDPTPASAPARGGHSPLPVDRALPSLGGATGLAPAPVRHGGDATGAATGTVHHTGGGFGLWWLAPVALLLAAGVGLAVIWLGGGRGPEARLHELERALARTGRPLATGVTLAELEHRFRGSPEAAEYVRGLRLARYRGAGVAPPRGARRALRQQLADGLGLTGRLRAWWALPPRRLSAEPGGDGGTRS